MNSTKTNGISRRSLMASAGAFGAASLAFPNMAVSQDGKVLTVRSYADLQVLDPAFRKSAPDQDIITSIFAPMLATISGDVWESQMVAVESLEQLDDLTLSFKLRDKIGFTDGYGQMTADDVKFSLERVADPAMESPYAGDWAALKEVEVKDTLSGLIHLKEKFVPLWASTLPTATCSILSRKAVEELGGQFTTEVLAQSGQYLLTEWVPRQRTILKRNPDWAYEPGGFEEIHIIPIEDASTAERGFESGDLDYTWTSVSSLPRLKESPPPNSVVLEKPSLAYVWMGMNQDVAPFDNPNVRRAVQHAIDRQTVVDAAYFGAAAVGNGIIAPGMPGSRDSVTYDYDPDRARQLLAQEGATDLFVTLDILNTTERLTAAQVIQANLADVGIQCEIKQNDSGTFWSLGSKDGDYWNKLQLILQRYSAAPDPSWATVWFTPEQVGVWNWERWASDEYKELHDQGLLESDPVKRNEIYQRMEQLMDESGSYVFLTHEVVGAIHKDSIDPGLKPNAESLFPQFKSA